VADFIRTVTAPIDFIGRALAAGVTAF